VRVAQVWVTLVSKPRGHGDRGYRASWSWWGWPIWGSASGSFF